MTDVAHVEVPRAQEFTQMPNHASIFMVCEHKSDDKSDYKSDLHIKDALNRKGGITLLDDDKVWLITAGRKVS